MNNEVIKDFNTMLRNSKDMPRIKTITDDKTIKKYGGAKMLLALPIDYDTLMKLLSRSSRIA